MAKRKRIELSALDRPPSMAGGKLNYRIPAVHKAYSAMSEADKHELAAHLDVAYISCYNIIRGTSRPSATIVLKMIDHPLWSDYDGLGLMRFYYEENL